VAAAAAMSITVVAVVALVDLEVEPLPRLLQPIRLLLAAAVR